MYEFVADACVAAVKGDAYGLADVCELSDRLLHLMHPDMNHECVKGMTSSYPEASQDLFEGIMSEVEGALEKVGLTYDCFHSAWVIKRKIIQIPFPLGDRDIFVTADPAKEDGDVLTAVRRSIEEYNNGQDHQDSSIEQLERFLIGKGYKLVQCNRIEGIY